jgi:hypothetical protein
VTVALSRRRLVEAKLDAYLELTREWYSSVALCLDGENSPLLALARMRMAAREWAHADAEVRRGR